MSSPAIEFVNAGYSIAPARALVSHLNLAIESGETCVLVGRSGSGKTTTLKLINRLLTPTAGQVNVEGTPVTRWDLIRLRRHIGYAIQDVGLFPHYSVYKNVALIPRVEGWSPEKTRARVEEVLQLVGLPVKEFASRFPHELSGGQRQRVGLARAIAADPPILLMDEPFGALDPITRADMQRQFQSLQRRLNKTVVFVTHDISEALLLGHRIGLMENGALHGVYSANEFLQTNDAVAKPYIDVFKAQQQLFQV